MTVTVNERLLLRSEAVNSSRIEGIRTNARNLSIARVGGLMADLADFVNRGDIHPIVQIGVAHAQFESIHPFIDGNGRTGRALTQALLRRRGLPCVPLSSGLMAARDEYYRSLDAYRLAGAEESIRIHARALRAAAAALTEATDRSSALVEAWRHRMQRHSPGPDREVLLPWLLGNPAFTTPQFESATQMPERSRRRMFAALADAGVIRRAGFTVGAGPSVAVWEAPEVFGVLDELERRTVALMQSG